MVKISRKVMDVDTLSGVEETPVYLNGVLKGVTDEAGGFSFDAPPGKYLLEIRPREFLPIKRRVVITADGKLLDEITGKSLKMSLPMSRATL